MTATIKWRGPGAETIRATVHDGAWSCDHPRLLRKLEIMTKSVASGWSPNPDHDMTLLAAKLPGITFVS